MNRFGLPEDVLNDLKNILKKYPEIKKAKIFGSRAKGNFKRYSDIDLALFTKGNESIVSIVEEALDQLDVIYIFDVVDYDLITNDELKSHIDRVGIEI